MASSPTLAQALLEALDDSTLEVLAELLAPRLASHFGASTAVDHWVDTKGAAEYLATSKDRVYDLVQLRKLVPAHDGRRLLFRTSDLDAYVAER